MISSYLELVSLLCNKKPSLIYKLKLRYKISKFIANINRYIYIKKVNYFTKSINIKGLFDFAWIINTITQDHILGENSNILLIRYYNPDEDCKEGLVRYEYIASGIDFDLRIKLDKEDGYSINKSYLKYQYDKKDNNRYCRNIDIENIQELYNNPIIYSIISTIIECYKDLLHNYLKERLNDDSRIISK